MDGMTIQMSHNWVQMNSFSILESGPSYLFGQKRT